MYKLLIVDDEPVIRERLLHAVEWSQLGFEVCGAAANGREALERIGADRPDAVLADIVMEPIDGLEFMRRLRDMDLNPMPKVVFLSGYDRFDYVQEAIHLGASDYLLKPLDTDALQALFCRIARELNEQKTLQLHLKRANRILNSARNELPGQIVLHYLQTGCADQETVQLVLEPDGAAERPERFALAFLRFAGPLSLAELQSFMERAGTEAAKPMAIPCLPRYILLFSCPRQEAEAFLIRMITGGSLPGCQCTLSDALALEQLPRAYDQFFANAAFSFYHPLNQVIPLSGTAPAPASPDAFISPNALFDLIGEGDCGALQHQLRSMLSGISDSRINPDTVIIRLTELYVQTASLCVKAYGDMDVPEFDAVYRQLQMCFTVHDLSVAFETLMLQMLNRFQETAKARGDLFIRLREYIGQHYMENLSLESLAQRFYLNASYLSASFSRKTGMQLMAYIRNVRLEKAAELLSKTTMHVSEVSHAVGYESCRHFSRLFREKYHMTPKEWRYSHLGGD